MPKSVLIVGSGPAGMASAHAARGMGCEVKIVAPKVYRIQKGSLILHHPIPGVTLSHPDGWVGQRVIGGTILDYRRKLYGDVNININGDVLEEGWDAWQMSKAYAVLWGLYEYLIEDRLLSAEELVAAQSQYDLVVNTAPRPNFCKVKEHEFKSKTIWMTNGAQPGVRMNEVVYNGGQEERWVRSSNIFGDESTEWAEKVEGAWPIKKPLSTTCDCHPGIFRTGRFGSWVNETWVDTAYYQVRGALRG